MGQVILLMKEVGKNFVFSEVTIAFTVKHDGSGVLQKGIMGPRNRQLVPEQ